MIYTLNILKERVIRDLSGGDIPDDSPYNGDHIIAHIVDAAREDLKIELLPKRGQPSNKATIQLYIATYEDVPVQVEKSTARVYIDLPSLHMTLKYNKGIHAVSPMKSPLNRYIQVQNPGVTSRLPHGDFERQNVGYYQEGLKIFWMRDIKKDEVNTVLLKLLVPAPDTWTFDEPLPLIAENVARILDMVKNRIKNPGVNNRLNDGNPNLRPANV